MLVDACEDHDELEEGETYVMDEEEDTQGFTQGPL